MGDGGVGRYRPHGWAAGPSFRGGKARRFIPAEEPQSTLVFTLGRYMYRAWVTNMDLTPSGVWQLLRWACRHGTLESANCVKTTPSARFPLRRSHGQRVIPGDRPACLHNLVTAFQRNCLEESWQSLTLQKLRYKLFLLPGELTRPAVNRPVLRLRGVAATTGNLATGILPAKFTTD